MAFVQPNTVVRAAELELTLEPTDGSARAGTRPLMEFGGLEVGIWEMTPGEMTDVEADEVFVVLSGAATVEFADGATPLTLGPGDVVRLAAGTETVWTVTETLRKVYLAG
ncbi:MAG: cupin domain-containing protein [Mycolicibacterium cosmeticum]|nr:cupin domain-containing protein [Mycolicibacterium cosmeticum]